VNLIKDKRSELGLTQKDLVEKSGLSLRTIQRLEASDEPPKGHSLQVLAKAFNLGTDDFLRYYNNSDYGQKKERLILSTLNLSILSFCIIPFGNLIWPFMIWRYNQESEFVTQHGRQIINVQILFTLVMMVSLIISPFIDPSPKETTPLILYVLLIVVLANVVIVGINAQRIRKEHINLINPPIQFL